MNGANIKDGFVSWQIIREQLLQLRRSGSSISIPNHDRELVVGDKPDDVSYCIVGTAMDYEPPEV